LQDQLVHKVTVSPNGTKIVFPVKLEPGEARVLIHCAGKPDRAGDIANNSDHRWLSVKIQSLRFLK
jgi:hypothetical protein